MTSNKKALEAIKSVLPAIAAAMNNAIVESISIALEALAEVDEDRPDPKPGLRLAPVEAAQQSTQDRYASYPHNLTITQAADMVKLPYSRMYELSRSRVTPFRQVGKKKRMVFKDELLAFLEERKNGSLLAEYDEDDQEAV